MPPKKKKTGRAKKTKNAKKAAAEAPGPKERKRRKDCPDCGSINIIFDPETEQLICQDCGLIFEELPPDLERRYEEVDLL
jgi:ribosomal protein S27E